METARVKQEEGRGRKRKEEEGRGRLERNSKRVVRNMKERNVGTKRKSLKQGLTIAEDLTIEL